MRYLCGFFASLYLGAFLLMVIGTFGLFGSEQDPLSGVFLIPLGMPWNLLADRVGLTGPIPAILAPAVNLAILMTACTLCRKRRARLRAAQAAA